jgi:hypothetical protein
MHAADSVLTNCTSILQYYITSHWCYMHSKRRHQYDILRDVIVDTVYFSIVTASRDDIRMKTKYVQQRKNASATSPILFI